MNRFAALALGALVALAVPEAFAQGEQRFTAADAVVSRAIVPEKEHRTGPERKLDSRLLFASRAHAAGRGAPQVPAFVRAFMDANVAPDGSVFVVIRAAVSEDLAGALRVLGARDVAQFPLFDTVTATVPIGLLVAIAERVDVRRIGPRELYETQRYFPGPDEMPRHPRPKTGSVDWQGVAAHQADKAHATGILGTGTKLCVLSDGVDSRLARAASGNLPSPIAILSGQAGSGDEGTAMLEIVHDMAPGASLGFATAIGATPSMAQFATNILNLRASLGCDVIVDDVSYFAEGAFQDGPIAQAVNTVTASGALYFSSAANSGSLTHGTSATYEGDFLASAAAPPGAIAAFEGTPVTLHAFGATPYTTLTRATPYVTLHWGEKLGGSSSDYDLFVMDSTGSVILGSPGADFQDGTQDPFETAACEGSNCTFPVGARVYVVKYAGQNRAIRVNAIRGRIGHGTSGSTFGHAATSGAIAVGAVDVRIASGGSFTGGAANPTTSYSSDGPRKFLFTPGGAAVTPGNTQFASGGLTVAKVDIAAADCGSTTTPGFSPFCGTSAAAPTAAALAALIRSAKPSATPAQVESALLASALDIQAAGTDRDSGVGIPMAPASVRAMLAQILVAKSFSPALIAASATSQLKIQLQNVNAVALAGVAFTDTYPAPMVNALANAQITGTGCTGTLAAVQGGTTLKLTGGVVPAGKVCSYTVSVTSPSAGTIIDGSGVVTTPIGLDSPPFSARLEVGAIPAAPTGVAATASNAQATLTFNAPADTGGLPLTGFAITCTPSVGGAVVTTAQSSSPAIVYGLVNGTAYTCTIAAMNAAGTGPASAPSNSFTPARFDQSITFLSTPPSTAYPGGPAYTVSASGSTGGTPVLTIAPASGAICSISGSVVSFNAAGTCTIQANLAGNDYFNPAPQVTQSVTVVVPTGLVFDPPSLDFGPQSMGTTSLPRSVTVANYTGTSITVGSVAAAAPFGQTNDCGVLAAGASCTVQVTFGPGASAGAINSTLPVAGTLTVASSGAGSPQAVALAGTAEKSLVTHFYNAILDRPPDASGKAFWAGEAARLSGLGASINEVWFVMAGYFFNSAEYLAAGKSDAQFVGDLYRTFFDRGADPGGLAFWTGQIAVGLPREVVLFSFMFSTEFAALTQGIFGNVTARPEVNLVMDFFRGVLNRLPETSAFQYWVGRLKAAQCAGAGTVYTEVDAISAAFIFNPEYNNRHRNNTQFVTDMYYSFLRRGGDVGGVQYWINELNTGARNINNVRLEFLNSPEFGARVNAVIAAGCASP